MDARFLWLQQLCAEGVVEMRARPGERNEADLGTKMVDFTFKRNTPSATSGLEVMDGPRLQSVLIWNVRTDHETSSWL